MTRTPVLTALAAVVAVSALATGCGGGRQHVAVAATSTTVAATTTTAPSTTADATTTTAATTSTSGTAGCTPGALRVAQVPLTGGTGHFYEAWSLTNAGSTTCTLAAGQPALTIDDASGATVSAYVVTHLSSPTSGPVRLAPAGRAWFLTEEITTACGAGRTVGDGPFHYVVGLPGGPSLSWASPDLSGPTLSDFCATEGLAVGDLRSSRPSTPD
jgi:hypothetical protein